MNAEALASLLAANAERWPSMVIDFDAVPVMNQVAARLIAAKDRYKSLFDQTSVPWPVIALIHERECGQRWDRSIAQGDPWNAVSIHVPAGRGPFNSWEEAAVDALTACEHMDQWPHWDSVGGALTRLEMYNGAGYALMVPSRPSPYVWSRTDQYASGKYVADHDFNPNVIDSQEGCAPLLAAMMTQDPTILEDFPSWGPPPEQPGLTTPDGILCDTNWLQACLNQLGAAPPLEVDGGWGSHTMAALRTWQISAGLPGSGRYNVPTRDGLIAALAAKAPATQG